MAGMILPAMSLLCEEGRGKSVGYDPAGTIWAYYVVLLMKYNETFKYTVIRGLTPVYLLIFFVLPYISAK